MIRNEKQHAVTKSWIRDFERSVSALDDRLQRGRDPLAVLERDGLRGQLEDLRDEAAEYERLVSGDAGAAPCDLEDLPGTLVKRRMLLGMSERDVAERLGLEEEEVREYEKTGYEGASYDMLMAALSALSVDGDEAARYGAAADFEGALDRLSRAGLDEKFVADHILYEPAALRDGAMRDLCKPRLLARLEALFGWTSRQVLGGEPLALGPAEPDARGRAADPRSLHVAYASGMAGILGGAARCRKPPGLGGLREAMAGGRGPASFAALVGRAWDSGIPVMRLGSLAFRSACLRGGGGRAVVVLSGDRDDEAGLMLDLLRGAYCAGAGAGCECVHGGRGPGGACGARADEFAYSVLLGDADGMLRMCLARCAERGGGTGGLPMLGEAAAHVAKREGVRPDSLACYAVHRLVGGLAPGCRPEAIRGLQKRVEDWPAVVSDAILERVDLSALGGSALALLTGAVRAGYGRGPPAPGAQAGLPGARPGP